MTLIPPPGYMTREKAERIGSNFRAGLDDVLERLRIRLHDAAAKITPEMDRAAIEALIKVETDRGIVELGELEANLREQINSTEH